MNISKLIQWADNNENIRALILTGSQASKGKKDQLSDYDIAVYCRVFDFLSDDDWINEIGKHLVCIHDKFSFFENEIPTRLTIFDVNFKADFSFHSIDLLETLSSSKVLPDSYNIGFKVLVDKDNALTKISEPTYEGFKIKKPDHEEFQNNVNEFWFEVYHEVKYLLRGDLWTAKFRDQAVKEKLLQMLEWNQAARRDWNFSPKDHGKEMKDWIDESIWKELHKCFGSFDKEDSMNALKSTIEVYKKAAIETAGLLGFEYNFKLDQAISKF